METFIDSLQRQINTGDILFCLEQSTMMVGKVVIADDGQIAFESHAFADTTDGKGWVVEYPDQANPIALKFFKRKESLLVNVFIIGIEILHPERLRMDFILDNFDLDSMEEKGFFVETDIFAIRKQLAA